MTKLDEARYLVEAGRYKKAVEKLWLAEADARADPERLRELLSVATGVAEAAGDRSTGDLNLLIKAVQEGLDRVAKDGPAPTAGLPTEGWYPDPAGSAALRFWDGQEWTSDLAAGGMLGSDTKTCPDCAEEIKSAARVCRFCGYRFDAAI